MRGASWVKDSASQKTCVFQLVGIAKGAQAEKSNPENVTPGDQSARRADSFPCGFRSLPQPLWSSDFDITAADQAKEFDRQKSTTREHAKLEALYAHNANLADLTRAEPTPAIVSRSCVPAQRFTGFGRESATA